MKTLSEVKAEGRNLFVNWLKSEDPLLDLYLGKGLPFGRIIQIIGNESSGKTAISLYLMSLIQKMGGIVLYIDSEYAMEEERFDQMLDPDKTVFMEEDRNVIESIEDCIYKFLTEYGNKNIPLGIVIDSLAQMSTVKEMTAGFDEELMGKNPKAISKFFRRITSKIDKYKVFFIVNNHRKEKMGVVFGDPEYAPGGKTKDFMYSIMWTASRKNADAIEESKKRNGIVTRLTTKKNKLAPREKREVFIPIYFDKRFISEKTNMLENLMRYGIVEKSGSIKKKTKNKKGKETSEDTEVKTKGYTYTNNKNETIDFTKKEFNTSIYDEYKEEFIGRIEEEMV